MASSFSLGPMWVVRPLVLSEFASSLAVRNVFNPVIGGGVQAVAFSPAPRSGSMTAIFLSLAEALEFEHMLSSVAPITWTDDTGLSITFLADQSIDINRGDDLVTLEDGESAFLWAVSFSYQEVTT